MPRPIDKREILAALRSQLEENLRGATASQKAVQDAATHPENRSEHAKDMRATEVSYVARGLAARVAELQGAIAALANLSPGTFRPEDTIALTALVALADEDGQEALYFLVPAGGGEKLSIKGAIVRTLTPTSPLGGELIGRQVDDEVELPGGSSVHVSWIG
jgi:transcription elongation GreA/GreB family factor